MSAAIISLNEDQILNDLILVINSALGNPSPPATQTIPVIRGLVNRTPMPPADPGFVCVTPSSSSRLSTNSDTYDSTAGTIASEQDTSIGVAVDFYGAASWSWATMFGVLMRSGYACDLMTVAQPLYADDPQQIPLVDSEQQYEERWRVKAVVQANPSVSTAMGFADTVGTVTVYPPSNDL